LASSPPNTNTNSYSYTNTNSYSYTNTNTNTNTNSYSYSYSYTNTTCPRDYFFRHTSRWRRIDLLHYFPHCYRWDYSL
jgi:hypothetical protein